MNDQKPTVLVVEDDDLISEMVIKNLKLEGYQVEAAHDGEEGIRKAKAVNPDLVLLDVLLPRLDGWDVLTQLRENPRVRDIPIIMLTAVSDEKSKVQGLRGGADDYVTKPFSALELIARIEVVLKRAGKAGSNSQGSTREQISARKGEKIYLVNVDDINFVSVQNNYTYLHTNNDRLLANYTLAELEIILNPGRFFRAHRGYIVNLHQVKEIARVGNAMYELTVNDPAKSKIPVSRRQSSELRKLLNI